MLVLFVCSGNKGNGISNLAVSQANSLIDFQVKVEFYYIRGKGIWGYLGNILPLQKQIRSKKYNLIHSHYGLCGVIALLAKEGHDKLIISFMGNDLLGDHAKNGKSTYFGNILVIINKFSAKYADYIIVKSKAMAGKLSHNRLSIIPNGIDLSLFYAEDQSIAIKKIGWDNQFRHLLFMADPERPEKNFKLIEKALLLLKGENYQIHFLKDIPHLEVIHYYNAVDACLLSSYHEGSPNVIKEAMATNCPAVATDVGDIRWLFGTTEGYFIADFNPVDFAKKIILAAEFRKINKETKGRERITELGLDSETVARKILDVYNEVLKIKS